MRYLIRFSYDGSRFYGFQRQEEKITVQRKLEDALSIINKSPVVIKGAGRTDVGVHANGQCAHFDLDFFIPEDRLKHAVNQIVKPYIYVLDCVTVDADFHARFSTVKKKYVYKIWLGEFTPFKYDYYLLYGKEISTSKLEECAKLFIGKHNFHNFVSGERLNYNAEIFDIKIEYFENELDIVFEGKSFYRYMVRNLVGAMLDYNEGKCGLSLIQKMLEDENYHYQLRTESAKGLYLENVFYE